LSLGQALEGVWLQAFLPQFPGLIGERLATLDSDLFGETLGARPHQQQMLR
jgi:hypothetical protein